MLPPQPSSPFFLVKLAELINDIHIHMQFLLQDNIIAAFHRLY